MDLDRLKADLALEEGLRLKPYRCTAGRLTIGYGRNIQDVGISEDEARYLLENDVRRVTQALYRALPWVTGLPEPWMRALAHMAFQLGLNGLLGFEKMLAALEEGNGATAYKEALDSAWFRQTPARAQRVAKLFLEGSRALPSQDQ